MSGTRSDHGIAAAPVRSCYLCGSDGEALHAGLADRLFGVPGVWGLIKCADCGLVWLDPRPERGEIPKLYERYHTHSPLPGKNGNERGIRRAVREAALRQAYGYRTAAGTQTSRVRRFLAEGLGRFGPLRELAGGSVLWLGASRRGRLLDVGCGSGSFLAHMRELGWEVRGLEPDPAAAEVARTRFDLDVVCSPIEKADIASESFDVVTLGHVIEHVHDPVAVLREVRRLVRRDGTIVVITPNSRSLGSRWLRSSWRGWEVPRHLFVFSPQTLRTCAERAGLRVAELRTTARSARDIWRESRLAGKPYGATGGSARGGIQPLPFWLLEHLATAVMPVGEEILMVAGP